MRKTIVSVVFLFILFTVFSCSKRPPRQIPEVIRFNMVYFVDTYRLNRGDGNYVKGWDIRRNMRLWTLKVYDHPPGKKIAITSLFIKNGNLWVENELGDLYEVSLRTHEVEKKN